MLALASTPQSLEVQRSVVIEEFKQRYLNQPYGDVWLELRPLAYQTHPYKWATIGKSIDHIEEATMQDVKAFFKKHYTPSNAILCIAGNLDLNNVRALVEKWYGSIPAGNKYQRPIQIEAHQTEYREKLIERNVPSSAFYYAFKMMGRNHPDYFVADSLSDALGRDKSSRLYVSLKKNKQLVSEINAYITGSIDTGLLIISGKLNEQVSFQEFDTALWEEINKIKTVELESKELDRIMIKIRTSREFQEQGLLNRAMNLSMYELLGDANRINDENRIYSKITTTDILKCANEILQKTNCSVLKVKADKNAR